MTGLCKVEQILTITFTNKAANEMYRRIYSLLSQYAPQNEYAKTAIENFHKARISTLDSFCMTIGRSVCRHFGISPDFESNDIQVQEIARSLALRFVLDKRNNPALQQLIAEKKMRLTADELFVQPVLRYSPISSPLDFNQFEKTQRVEILVRWNELTALADSQITLMEENSKTIDAKTKLYAHLSAMLPHAVKAPKIESLFSGEPPKALAEETQESIVTYIDFLANLLNYSFGSAGKAPAAQLIKEAASLLKEIYEKIEALANHALQWNIVTEVFPLIAEYQNLLNNKKRENKILTFTDIAHLAVDGLRLFPDIRRMYRDSFRMIMIDEFQDNNRLQRELVDLLLDPAKVFYVGDEKQSIYRFRGADVSVFRGLAEQSGCKLELNTNYRSSPALICAFNHIFGGFSGSDDSNTAEGVFPAEKPEKDFEANYRRIKSRNQTKGALSKESTLNNTNKEPPLHFAFFDKGLLAGSEDSLTAEDYEARYIAEKIQSMVKRKYQIEDKDTGTARPCAYGDFAVLQRSHTHQHSLEKAFKLFGVSFNADRPAGLFDDAPVNDLWSFLKLLVYPGDRIAYGAVLRSPFVRISEEAFTLCMLQREQQGLPVFSEALDEKLPPSDRFRYKEARRLYLELLKDSQELPVSSLLTKLWYNEGYRNQALWTASSQIYLNLYDLFFEQARSIEDQGKGLVDFLDYLEDLANKKDKIEDSVLPGEEESGVRIMTIHRCKGLEFPVVFVCGCGSNENISFDKGLAFYSEKWGIVLELPQAEELENVGNYFYLAEKDLHREKTEAELRRLLYVAMTRAEQELYITAAIPPQNKKEREELPPETYENRDKEFIARRLEQYRAKTNLQSLSFLRLLPVLSADNPLYTIEAIGGNAAVPNSGKDSTLSKKPDQFFSMKENALLVRGDYETIPVVPAYQPVPQTINASSVHMYAFAAPVSATEPGTVTQGKGATDSDGVDALLRQTGLEPQEFGVIVHQFIEDRFNNRTPQIPRRFASRIGDSGQLASLAKAAQTMAEGFFDSPLGRKAVSASFIKTEYPILTAVNQDGGACGKIIISGKIDLLFDAGEAVYVVDFKTDREEDISRHTGQLAVYKRAAEDIFGKPVECRLFYLRTRQEADLTSFL